MLHDRKAKLFLKHKRSKQRPSYSPNKWRFSQALFPTVVEWIRQRARAANYVSPTNATPLHRDGSSKPTSSVTCFRETTLATHSSTQKCIYCSKEHSVMQCSKLRDMSVDERVEWAAKQLRCFSCLGLRHKAYQCRKAQKCGVSACWRRHHPLLHQDRRSSANEASEAHEHVEAVAHAATSHLQHATRVFLRIVPIVLEGPAGELCSMLHPPLPW